MTEIEYQKRQLRLDQQEVKILKAKRARNNFADFFELTSPYRLENWQRILCNRLDLLKHQTGQRIRIHKPPQHGGSIVLSQRLPPYLIGNDPSIAIRLVSYNETHSTNFGIVIKKIIQSQEYKLAFPSNEVYVSKNAPASEWSTSLRKNYADARSSFKALGLQTGIVGTGGNLWIIDDPYKSREEAFSDTINEKVWNTWSEDISARLAPDDNVIVMYHTYNERDFSAKLKEQGGWEDIRIPAICDSLPDFCGRELGEALSPRYPVEYLIGKRDGYVDEKGEHVAGIGLSAFESLYQGNPTSRDGSKFKLNMFNPVREYKKEPDGLFVRYWDLASSEEKTADRTSGTLMYKTPSLHYTIIDHRADRLSPSGVETYILNTCKQDQEKYGRIAPIYNYIEQQIGVADVLQADAIIRKCAEYGIRKDNVKGKDKELRAVPLIAQMEIGNVDILEGEFINGEFVKFDWYKELRDEMLSFPGGKHDDRVDSTTGAFNKASEIFIL